ncbi:alpha-amylase [Aerosakkonema funiforme]|uniref:alpha-amylase n=1 Tax=Aerosakkonema funiforme TaxID=1246630 RepID=UPI0035B8E489
MTYADFERFAIQTLSLGVNMAETNGVMMQYFHWYNSNDGTYWEEVKNKAKELAEAGFTALWLPPAFKGKSGAEDVGYGVYDLFDLGEFDQKGSVRTKYGTREQYLAAIKALQAEGIEVYADVVLNHKDGADDTEMVKATPFYGHDRSTPSGELQEIEAYTHFKFPGRKGKYSPMEWHWWHFDAVNYNHQRPEDLNTVYLLEGKSFDDFVSLEQGNFAFLLGCDLDMESEEVREELARWGKWYLDTTGVDGFRLDAIKHISSWFFVDWLDEMRRYAQRNFFVVGEYWTSDLESLHWYINNTGGRMSLFDVPLHFNFHTASQGAGHYDMRHILNNTLMQQQPSLAVTFVENHDSQPLQSLESSIASWFKPLAYALILLRQEGYPCVFYADYYGAEYDDKGIHIQMQSHRYAIDKFLYARKHYGYGPQYDYFDHPNIIGWTRLGDSEHPKGMAVMMSDGPGGSKWMEVGKPNSTFVDLMEYIKEPVHTNEEGWGEFPCDGGSVSVWIEQ